jgi:hypothetical protein
MVSARQAIEQGDRSGALELLARIARGELPAEDLEPVVSEAQVATARAEQEERDRAALARIRGVVDQLDEVLREQEEERQRDEHMGVASAAADWVRDRWKPSSFGASGPISTSERRGGTAPSMSAR